MPRRALFVVLAGHPLWILACLVVGEGGVWLPLGTTALLLGAACLWAWPEELRRLLRPRPRAVLLGLLGGAALAGLSHALYPPLRAWLGVLSEQTQGLYALMWRGPGPLAALPVLVGIIVVEELMWRGLLQSGLERRLGRGGAALLTPLLYALAQAGQGSTLLVAVALLVGVAFSLLRAMSRELWAPLLAHLVWDLVVLVFFPLEAVLA